MTHRTPLDHWLRFAGPAGYALVYYPEHQRPELRGGVRLWSPTRTDVWVVRDVDGAAVGYRQVHAPHANPFEAHSCLYEYHAPAVHVVRAMLALPGPDLPGAPEDPKPMSARAFELAEPFAELFHRMNALATGPVPTGEPPAPMPPQPPAEPSPTPGDLSRWFRAADIAVAVGQ